ncbi:MAG: YrhK family protein [Halothece sp.]
MPRLFTNRPRHSPLFNNNQSIDGQHFKWETINAILYIVGGFSFIIGSIFFLPQFDDLSDIGAWIFFGGSLVYLIVTGSDLLEATAYLRSQKTKTIWNWLEFYIANVYVGGTVLFTIGSLLFLSEIDKIVAGGWCFTIGSLLFLIGACLNVIQIVKEQSFIKLQLLNATAITFALGSMLFLIASLPYLSEALTLEDNWVLFSYVAWEYIAGSILFLIGGIFHYYRSYKKHHYQPENIILEWENSFYQLEPNTPKQTRAKQLKLQAKIHHKIQQKEKEVKKYYYVIQESN